jgi:hypothetical protein
LAFNELRQTRNEKKSKSPSNHEISVNPFPPEEGKNRIATPRSPNIPPCWLVLCPLWSMGSKPSRSRRKSIGSFHHGGGVGADRAGAARQRDFAHRLAGVGGDFAMNWRLEKVAETVMIPL